MSFLDHLKSMFGGKKDEPGLFEALDRQVDALEQMLIISERGKRIEGGIEGFDMAYEEVRQTLASYGESPGQEELELLTKRMNLARDAAHLLREQDPEKKKQMCGKFVADFRPLREHLHFRTKTKYERIRIDFESGRSV